MILESASYISNLTVYGEKACQLVKKPDLDIRPKKTYVHLVASPQKSQDGGGWVV